MFLVILSVISQMDCVEFSHMNFCLSRVSGLVLRGICTMRQKEIDWMFRGGAAPLFPQVHYKIQIGLCCGVSNGSYEAFKSVFILANHYLWMLYRRHLLA